MTEKEISIVWESMLHSFSQTLREAKNARINEQCGLRAVAAGTLFDASQHALRGLQFLQHLLRVEKSVRNEEQSVRNEEQSVAGDVPPKKVPGGTACPTCPVCKSTSMRTVRRSEVFPREMDGKTLVVRAIHVPRLECGHCGCTVQNGEVAAEADKIRNRAICEAAGFLPPGEYKRIRETMTLWSRHHLAFLSGYSVKMITDMEDGVTLPPAPFDTLLRAIQHCPALLKFYDEHLQRLHPTYFDFN